MDDMGRNNFEGNARKACAFERILVQEGGSAIVSRCRHQRSPLFSYGIVVASVTRLQPAHLSEINLETNGDLVTDSLNFPHQGRKDNR